MAEITKIKTANHDEWVALRSSYIGGSDAAAVVGLNPFSTPYSLWAEKTGRLPGFSGNLTTEVGTYLEDFVAKKFEEETGKKVRRCNHSLFNSKYPWAIANIDREVIGEDAGLECKSTSELNLKKFKGGEYPAQYYCQCVHYMAVTGKRRWYLAVLIGNRDFKWFTIERDEAEIAALMTAEEDFWKLVEEGTPPAVDGYKATTEAINAMYAESDDSTVDLYMHHTDLKMYMELGKQIKELEALQEEAKNRIKAFMADAGTGESSKYRVLWKSQTRRTFDSKRFAKENPGIDLSSYYKEITSRPFRVAELKGE